MYIVLGITEFLGFFAWNLFFGGLEGGLTVYFMKLLLLLLLR